jgi:ABC-type hemin transport system ATPase subunit
MQVADQLILLKSGRLIAADSPVKLINQPLLDEAFGIPLKRQRIEGNSLPWLSPASRE